MLEGQGVDASLKLKHVWLLEVQWKLQICLRFYAQQQLLLFCLSVRLSVTRVDQSKTVQARITKSTPSAALIVKLFHKFEEGHSERGR